MADLQTGCRHALEIGWSILSGGGSAVEAVETVIGFFEDNPAFNAGTGSHLNLDGHVELDAIVMDGQTLRAGAVAAVSRIRNPIRLARRVLEASPHMMLVAAGAEQFAVEQGIPLCDPAELITEQARAEWLLCRPQAGDRDIPPPFKSTGTVGAVALDQSGRLAAGTSTGGTPCKHAGRVGDSPLIGCGCYADAEAGGASCTGWGEAIMKIVMAKAAVDLLRDPLNFPVDAAAREAARLLKDAAHGTGGIILLDREGHPGFAFNTPRMPYGFISADSSIVVGI
jgi:L-asparaginase / beta-aspartyl-peptidase